MPSGSGRRCFDYPRKSKIYFGTKDDCVTSVLETKRGTLAFRIKILEVSSSFDGTG